MEKTVKNYEAMFLLNNGRISPENKQGVGLVSDLLTKHAAEIVRVDVWDERKLAYPVGDQKRGTFVLAHFRGTADTVTGISRDVSLSEDILRLQVTRHEKEFPIFRTASEMDALKPRRDLLESGGGGGGGRRRRDDDGGDGEGRGRGRWRSRDEEFGDRGGEGEDAGA